jgi:hypothetical protein
VSGALKRSSARVVPGGLTLQLGRQLVISFTCCFTLADILAGGASAQLDRRRLLESREAAMVRVGTA